MQLTEQKTERYIVKIKKKKKLRKHNDGRLINNDFLKHKQANFNVRNRRKRANGLDSRKGIHLKNL